MSGGTIVLEDGRFSSISDSDGEITLSRALTIFRPLLDRVLVRELPQAQSIGLIHIPETATLQTEDAGLRTGEVVAVGPGEHRCLCGESQSNHHAGGKCYNPKCSCVQFRRSRVITRTEVKAGDRVLYWRNQGAEVKLDGVEMQIVNEEQHIVAVLPPDAIPVVFKDSIPEHPMEAWHKEHAAR